MPNLLLEEMVDLLSSYCALSVLKAIGSSPYKCLIFGGYSLKVIHSSQLFAAYFLSYSSLIQVILLHLLLASISKFLCTTNQ